MNNSITVVHTKQHKVIGYILDMNTHSLEYEHIDSIVPGAIDAYELLRDRARGSLFTSHGRYYNHTIFARDLASAARFVGFFEHDTARAIMRTLVALQGTRSVRRTQEETGRIHHEYRDFSKWEANFVDKLAVRLISTIWGAKRGKLLTYFSSDTSASFIRAVYRYAQSIDNSLLDSSVRTKEGEEITIQQSVEAAARWIMAQVDSEGRFIVGHSPHSLPYQTLQDSVTAYSWSDGRPVNYKLAHSFVEAQSFNASALENISHLLAGRSEQVNAYKETAHHMRRTLLRDYWDSDKHFFTSVLSQRDGVLKPLDVPNISSGWVLNASWWSEVPVEEKRERIQSVVNRLFSDEFLTPVGMRTRSKYLPEPLGSVVDYHGSQTVWPMFNFMVIEGLVRHRLYKLAEELENRLINGVNCMGQFPEFLIVTKHDEFCRPVKDIRLTTLSVQMIPERHIAFTVVPLIAIARGRMHGPEMPEQEEWQTEIERAVLARLESTLLYEPDEAVRALRPRDVYLTRGGATFRSIAHIMKIKS